MRRSTLIAIGILVVLLGGMMWLLNFYVDQLKPELESKKALTAEWKPQLAPGTDVKLLRVIEAPKEVGGGGKQPGLNVEASPSAEAWKADATGGTFATGVARSASKRYGPERPIQWLKVTLSRAGAADVVFVFRVGDDRDVVQVSRTEAPAPR